MFKFLQKIILVGAVMLLPKIASAATIYLSPASGSVTAGSNITINVQINTGGVAVNTAEANITFSSNLQLVSVKQGSVFYLSSPGSPGKTETTGYFAGGLPTPGYNGATGNLGTMVFKAKTEGSATVSVGSGKILLNDGKGTNAYTGSSGTKITILPPPVGAVTVNSASHPDPNSWYAKSDVSLSWAKPTGAYGYSFILDQIADTVPDNTIDATNVTTQTYTDLKDGAWYFHIKARGSNSASAFGQTTNFRIGVDTQRPLLFEVKLVGENNINDVSSTPTVNFEAIDETSGIDHYDLYLDDQLIGAKAITPYTLTTLSSGSHRIRVEAFDKAGNYRKAEVAVIVKTPPVAGFFQRNLTLPIYLILLLNLMVIAIFLWLLWRKRQQETKPGLLLDDHDRLRTEIDVGLNHLRLEISKELMSLSEQTHSVPMLQQEAVAAGTLAEQISTTRKTIYDKLRNYTVNASFDPQIFLSPQTGNLKVGEIFTISVFVDTKNQNIQTAEVNIIFSPETLELLDVSQGSTFWSPMVASSNKGAYWAYFGGSSAAPGYKGSGGVLGTMKFRAKAAGDANVIITAGRLRATPKGKVALVTNFSSANMNISGTPIDGIAMPASPQTIPAVVTAPPSVPKLTS